MAESIQGFQGRGHLLIQLDPHLLPPDPDPPNGINIVFLHITFLLIFIVHDRGFRECTILACDASVYPDTM